MDDFFLGAEVGGDTPSVGLKGCLGFFFCFPFPFWGAKGGFGDGVPRKKLGKLKDIHAILIPSPFMGFSSRNFLEGAAIFWGVYFLKVGPP